ncbi:lysozyme inhibitor LprI family protein [Hydrogenophaga sp. MI9]|uniref:lysozyme inhibitor LprI family protein n=1 Tax=Hydrogenophaga sp. MI9 TaxID=3453719 RepID=UPI003EEAEBAA
MNVRPLAAALAVLLCGAAHAEEPKYTPAYTACVDKSGGVTVEMLNCGSAELDVQDKRLNESYRALMAALPGKDKAALKASQRDWLKSRKSTCDFHAKVADGSMVSLIVQSCYLEGATRRAALLEHWASLKNLSR